MVVVALSFVLDKINQDRALRRMELLSSRFGGTAVSIRDPPYLAMQQETLPSNDMGAL